MDTFSLTTFSQITHDIYTKQAWLMAEEVTSAHIMIMATWWYDRDSTPNGTFF